MLFERGLTFPLGRIVAIDRSTRRGAETVAPRRRSRFRAGRSWRLLLLVGQYLHDQRFGDRAGHLAAGRVPAQSTAVLDDRCDRDVRRPRDEPDVRGLALDAYLGGTGLSPDRHVAREADHGPGAGLDDADHHR